VYGAGEAKIETTLTGSWAVTSSFRDDTCVLAAIRRQRSTHPQRLEGIHSLFARYNFGLPSRSMSSVRAHVLTKRVTRFVGRTVGAPLGIATVLILRLSARQAGVALMYHSVDHRAGDPARELVPPHEAALFERQIRHVRRHFEIVPARDLQEAARSRRRGQKFPVAITFDDDLACHATITLPILRRTGATATFFLSGASLDHPFAFHYERLQRAIDEDVREVPSLVTGRPGTTEPSRLHELGLMLELMPPEERDAASARLYDALGPDVLNAGIRRAQVRELADADMTIGFHTFRHDSLTRLTDDQLAQAMETGRDALADAVGAPVETIGYPHGRADERVAAAARKAGFRAGFTTQDVAVTPSVDPLLQGRVGPSLRSVGALAIQLALALRRSGGQRPTREPQAS
jgi:peptidoglycan/xylan/chitin deacetylase (PgdA/CDA1 family)